MSPVAQELRHPGESIAIDAEPLSQYIHEDGMVDGVEGGRLVEQYQGTDVVSSSTLIMSLCMLTAAVSVE